MQQPESISELTGPLYRVESAHNYNIVQVRPPWSTAALALAAAANASN